VDLPAHVVGVRPTEPGFKSFFFEPQTHLLEWAQIKVPTPHGTIKAGWRNEGRESVVEINVPEGTEATFRHGAVERRLAPGEHRLKVEIAGP
jgi:hypothetical protein